ncbi:MAG: isoprenyl transferase [Clostridiales Family XIII bacterium]|nr:isoprenyl transferase [Clostridiales Family XIII bacterium]
MIGNDLETARENLPSHVAIIMDGNGRWAEKRGLLRYFGHDAGMKAMTEIVRYASDMGIGYLSVYAFSTENWKRSEEEVSGIFKLLLIYVDKELDELHRNNCKVNILGDTTGMSRIVLKALEKVREKTKGNTGMIFNICLGYGGRAELARAARSLAGKVADGTIAPGEIDEDAITDALYTGGMPDPDLLIRPGGEKRLSNFMLWQCAYTEFVFCETLWPDFTKEDFDKAITEYEARKRRFGGRK